MSIDRSSADGARTPLHTHARGDWFQLFEDGQAGLASPATSPAGVVFEVLANDRVVPGGLLQLTSVQGAQHGTVQIVDGADADTLPGDAVLYTPDVDYSGGDSFTYSVSDGLGGADTATVTVLNTGVADEPYVTYEIFEGAAFNQTIVRVWAVPVDIDNSEFVDRIGFTGLPDGVSISTTCYNPEDEPTVIVQDFVLTLPPDADTDFQLGITAYVREFGTYDEENATAYAPIKLDFNHNQVITNFTATGQSIWQAGAGYAQTFEYFAGIDTRWNRAANGFVHGETDGHVRAGFDAKLNVTGGSVDGTLPYSFDVDTSYNRNTDVLRIDADAQLLPGGGFTTTGPGGQFQLDLIFDLLLHAMAGVDGFEIADLTVGPYNLDYNLFTKNSTDVGGAVDLPGPFSLYAAWPQINTASTETAADTYGSSGSSRNFLQLNLDVDALVSQFLGFPSSLLDLDIDFGPVSGTLQLADFDVTAGLNLLQRFSMAVTGLPGFIQFESGETQPFTFGSELVLQHASNFDVDGDGQVEFNLLVDPSAVFTNITDLGFNVGTRASALKLDASLDLVVTDIDVHLGPLFSATSRASVGYVGVYNQTFGLDFSSQVLTFAA